MRLEILSLSAAACWRMRAIRAGSAFGLRRLSYSGRTGRLEKPDRHSGSPADRLPKNADSQYSKSKGLAMVKIKRLSGGC